MSNAEPVRSSRLTDDRSLQEIVHARLSRRAILGGGLAAGAMVFVNASGAAGLGSTSPVRRPRLRRPGPAGAAFSDSLRSCPAPTTT